jgi:triosephosphate isomerase (TIM)
MRRKIVAGNWKMNADRSSGLALVDAIVAELGDDAAGRSGAEVVVCPPFVFIDAVARQLGGRAIAVGSQDVYHESAGAFTGEVSAPMLRSVGCTHAIVGHSERRTIFGESDDDVARKTRAAIAGGLTPIVCVGETLEERDAGRVDEVVGRQIDAALHGLELRDGELPIVVAYEPVWAIGTGRTATPEQAQEVHAFIRSRVATMHGEGAGDALRILYGGSVNAANAAELFARADIDGGLIGGASLKAHDFATIVRAAG